jgi:DNA (cytosine-5)-methyltransferase 1
MFTVNDFFCGCGGLGLGFIQAGFKIQKAWDFDKYAVQSYRENVGDHVIQADITKMTYQDVPGANVWAFGFPCQDLSLAGKQAGLFEGKRSGLFFEIMRLLDETAANNATLPEIL